ncbi:hypothetical protein FE845_18145 [Marinobacter sp. 1-4A]|uniref:hypothetical protein n=1 Tax=Marinobacter sp. 1-4A TaxID=2582919 RepID=UPI0019066FBC|nr:hypothetical protein [Marinobacter sp. 1-4A]MBK1853272.1 hypothetical protein [Marinobacter sp. 1-4A]
MMKLDFRTRAKGLCIALFGLSLLFPALIFEHREPLLGIQVLLSGWWGFLTFDFAWFANIAFFFALSQISRGVYGKALVANIFAIVLGLLSFLADEWWFNEGSGTEIIGLGVGFYIWMAAFIAGVVVCHIGLEPNQAVNRTPKA